MECPQCGAPLGQSSGGGFGTNQSTDRYVPGGGATPQQPATSGQPDPQGQRPLGSLQRRLQRSQASLPNDDGLADDNNWGGDQYSGGQGGQAQRSRAPEGQGYGSAGSRRSTSGDGYGERARRSQPRD
ncbi:MAG TPA: hypothetical protein VID72_11735, partial [Ktedonobacterales bacterium]